MAELFDTKQSPQNILNNVYDRVNMALVVTGYGYAGSSSLQRMEADNLSILVVTSGSDTFIGEAAPGTSAATAAWKAYKVDSSGNLTYADGDAEFNNVGANLASLTYT